MFSKRVLRILRVVSVVGVLVGCGLNTNERPRRPDPPSFSGKGYSCIGEIPEHFERYFHDQMSEGDINDFVHCLQKSVTSFAQLTRGSDQATYAPTEIRRFLQSYFLKERPISDQLMHEFMVTKQALIGGEVDRISRSELYVAIDVLEDLRKELIRLKPHIQVLNPNLAEQQPPQNLGERLRVAQSALHQSINTFNLRLQKSPRLYSFADLQSLLLEFRSYVNWERHFADALPIPAWINMLKSFKIAAVSSVEPRGIAGREWSPLLVSLSRWYLTYLQYRVGVRGQRVLEGVGLQNTVFLGKEIFDLMDEAVSRQPMSTLGFEPLMNVVEAAQTLGWISPKLRLCGLRSAVEGLVMRMYGDEHVPPDHRVGDLGLTDNALNQMRTDFSRWARTQLNLDKVYRAPLRSKVAEVHQTRLQPDIIAQLREPHGAEWADFQRVKKEMSRPLFPEEVSRVYLVNINQLHEHGLTNQFFNLSSMNLLRSLVTAIFRGYAIDGSSTDGFKTGIQSEEMQRFYVDFREVGIDLGLIDKRKFHAGTQAFLEANLFTYSANGVRPGPPENGSKPKTFSLIYNRYRDRFAGIQNDPSDRLAKDLTFVETMEYFAFLYSGGKVANAIFDDLSERCPHGPIDQYEKPMLGRACVIKALPEMIVAHAYNMPGLQDFLRGSKAAVAERFAANIVATAYSNFSTPEWVEYSEMTTISGIIHYLEAVMTRYDVNGDNRMDSSEISEAANVFSGVLQTYVQEKLHGSLSDTDARGAFRFILYHKRFPCETGGLCEAKDKFEIVTKWAQVKTMPHFSIDRSDLAVVFNLIIGKLGKSEDEVHSVSTCNATHAGE